jgi:hypothetical protein
MVSSFTEADAAQGIGFSCSAPLGLRAPRPRLKPVKLNQTFSGTTKP